MIAVNGVELNSNLVMANLAGLATSFGSERITLGGKVYARRMSGRKRTFSLVAERADSGLYGYFTHEQIVALASLRDAGTQVAFVYHSIETTVVIPMDGIQVTPLFRRTDPQNSLAYYGSVTFDEV